MVRRVDRRTNAFPDQQTDTASFRGALSHLKTSNPLFVTQFKNQKETRCIIFAIFQLGYRFCFACQI